MNDGLELTRLYVAWCESCGIAGISEYGTEGLAINDLMERGWRAYPRIVDMVPTDTYRLWNVCPECENRGNR